MKLSLKKNLLVISCVCVLALSSRVTGAQSSAEKYLSSAMNVFSRVSNGNVTGESFCWHAAYSLDRFVAAYRTYGDLSWLDCGVKYYDRLMEVRAEGPGGYKGFIGPYIYNKKVWGDVHIADAVIYDRLLAFAELVLGDTDLAARYGDKARYYIAEAEKHMIEKWDSRDTWRQDGPFGGYVSWTFWGEPGEFRNWTDQPPVLKGGLSLPFNKNNDVGVCCLRLYRLTGKKKYLDRAVSIFSYIRSRMQYVDGRFQWNYWEPLGPWDIKENGREFTHWINTHPYRNYQASEVGQIVEAYNSGVVFTEEDIKRIIKTNLDVMWNGDVENPEFVNSNVKLPGYRKPSASKAYPTWAGTLWGSLAQFDQTVRDIRRSMLKKSPQSFDGDYFEKVVCAKAPSFERTHVAANTLPTRPMIFDSYMGESAELLFVAALPTQVTAGGKMNLCCTAYVKGDVSISVYPYLYFGVRGMPVNPPVIFKGPIARPLIYQWDLTDDKGQALKPGDYVVRWTFKKGYREMPITIK